MKLSYERHGYATIENRHKLYSVWKTMKRRVKLRESYKCKGITVCNEWMNSFIAFKDWSFSSGYKYGLQIDRIDNNKGYYPENCRWVTNIVNSNNRNNTTRIYYNGLHDSLLLILRKLGRESDRQAIYGRIKRGWDVKLAIDTPIKRNP